MKLKSLSLAQLLRERNKILNRRTISALDSLRLRAIDGIIMRRQSGDQALRLAIPKKKQRELGLRKSVTEELAEGSAPAFALLLSEFSFYA